MTEQKEKALKNLKTTRGQIDGIIKMIEEGRYCIDISNQIMAAIALLKKANLNIMEGHLKSCVKNSLSTQDSDEKMNEVVSVLKRMMNE